MLSLVSLLLTLFPTSNDLVREGDRVTLVGGALIEREQQFGYLETMLHAMYPKTNFTVRNLGWSGDTVWGEARAGFGKPADGYRKLIAQIKETRPHPACHQLRQHRSLCWQGTRRAVYRGLHQTGG